MIIEYYMCIYAKPTGEPKKFLIRFHFLPCIPIAWCVSPLYEG